MLSLVLGLLVVAVPALSEGTADPDVPVLQDLDLLGGDPENPISIMILDKEDARAEAQTLLVLDQERQINIRVDRGPAHFLYRSGEGREIAKVMSVTYTSRVVKLPTVVPVHGDVDSYLSILADGVPVSDPIRVFLQRPGVFEAYKMTPALAAAVLRFVDGQYALIDLSRLIHDDVIRDYQNDGEVRKLFGEQKSKAPIQPEPRFT